MPPLPSGMAAKSPVPEGARPPSAKDHATKLPSRNIKTRGGDSILSASFGADGEPANTDLQSMLKGIDSRSRENAAGNLTKPPY